MDSPASPGSALSDYDSDAFPDDVKRVEPRRVMDLNDDNHDVAARPTKRQRVSQPAHAPSSPPASAAAAGQQPPEDPELSEDTDGSVPASPNHHPGMSQDDEFGQDQVTACKWEGCDAGDLGNMDNLVDHLHEDHIGTRQKKYSCEWSDCTRKGIPHASGYALRAHMRSHTREKPFYCTLPECDRSFTRSDALAKHMRTVHETEALRPSDPVPKHHSSNPSNKFQRVKLVLNDAKKGSGGDKASTPGSPSSHTQGPTNSNAAPGAVPPSDSEYAHNNVVYLQDLASPHTPILVQFPPDLTFSDRELTLPAPELFQLLRRQLQWATLDGEALRTEAEALEKQRREEWEAKELLLENYMEAQEATVRRGRVDEGLPELFEGFEKVAEDVGPSRKLPLLVKGGKVPWWRREEWVKRVEGGIREVEGKVPPSDVRQEEAAA